MPGLVPLWLLARRRRRQPGCKASGESKGNPEGESSLFPSGFPLLSLGQKPTNFSYPQRNWRKQFFLPNLQYRLKGSRGLRPLVQVHEGRRGPRPVVSFATVYPFQKVAVIIQCPAHAASGWMRKYRPARTGRRSSKAPRSRCRDNAGLSGGSGFPRSGYCRSRSGRRTPA